MPSFCATLSELVRQHPKRAPTLPQSNQPPPTNVYPTYALALSLAYPSQDASRDGKCVSQLLCVFVRTHVPRLWNSPPRRSREETHAIWLSLCTCMCVHTSICGSCTCLGICVYVYVCVWETEREGRFCWSVPECWKWQGGTVGKDPCRAVCEQKQTTAMEPCHWLVDIYSNMFGNPKNTLPAKSARFNHWDKMKRSKTSRTDSKTDALPKKEKGKRSRFRVRVDISIDTIGLSQDWGSFYIIICCWNVQTRGNYLWNFFWWQLSKAFASANQMGHFFKRFACFECVESAFCQAFSVFLNAQNIMRKNIHHTFLLWSVKLWSKAHSYHIYGRVWHLSSHFSYLLSVFLYAISLKTEIIFTHISRHLSHLLFFSDEALCLINIWF